MHLQRVSLHEVNELEPLVLQDLTGIEDGLTALDNQLAIGEHGRPDILGVDGDGALCIIELKSVTADLPALAQSIRYYEWFAENVALVSRPFPKVDPQRSVRIFIVAPDFTESIRRIWTYTDLDISLVRVFPVRNPASGETGVIYEHLERTRRDEQSVQLRSVDDIVKYITDDDARAEFLKVLEFLTGNGFLVAPYRGGKHHWLECTYDGDDIGYFQTRQKYFRCQFWDESKEEYIWPPVKCASFDDWNRDCFPKFEGCLEDEE